MRSTIEKMPTTELVKTLDRLDEALDEAMIEGDPTNESMDIFQTMELIIEELEYRHVEGWWSNSKG